MTSPLQRPAGPEFPLEALPEWLGVYVADVAASLQVPRSMAAVFALGALSTAGAGKAKVNPDGDWVEPLNLFLALVAPPGAKKSAVASAFTRPLVAFERELQEQAAPDLRRRRAERHCVETEIAKAKKAADLARLEELEERMDTTPIPVPPQLIADDITAQKLAMLLAQHGRMAVVSAEPSIFPTLLGRWSSGRGETELDVFLKGHAGDLLRVDRIGRPPDIAPSPCLTMCLALQPTALQRINRRDVIERGLHARFLWVLSPDVRGTTKLRNARRIPEPHRHDFEKGLRALLELEASDHLLRFDVDAGKAFEHFHDDFEGRIGPGGDLRNFNGWGEKHRGHVARLAGLLHLAEFGLHGHVSADTLARAIRIGEWAIAHAKIAFDAMDVDPVKGAARAILEVTRRLGETVVSTKDLFDSLRRRTGFETVAALRPGLALLCESGWFRPVDAPKKRGRPSERFEVDPRVFADTADLRPEASHDA